MADLWDRGLEPTDILPKSELNPLLNPLLERHLGRWAEVYFTAPPERREQAVEELLQELEKETAKLGEVAKVHSTTRADSLKEPEATVCSACEFKNCPDQNFCGNCGSPLPGGQISTPPEQAPSTGRLGDADAARLAIEHIEKDLQQMASRAFSQWDQTEPPASHRNQLFAAGTALGVLLAGFAYLGWISRQPVAPPSPIPAVVPMTSTLQSQAEAVQKPETSAAPQQPSVLSTLQSRDVQNVPAAQQNPGRKPDADVFASARQESPATELTPADREIEGGVQELLLAEQYLEGKTAARDSSKAARLLWQAVSKQNTRAALLLSDLYGRGDGVPKSCDQARLLLGAVARKGANAAARQILSLESNGCP